MFVSLYIFQLVVKAGRLSSGSTLYYPKLISCDTNYPPKSSFNNSPPKFPCMHY